MGLKVKGKTVLAAAFLLSLLAAGVQFVNLAVTNPYKGAPKPEEPDTSQPSVLIELPTNRAYGTEIVPYSVTVTKPSSWFVDNPVHGKISSIRCILDDGQRQLTVADFRNNESEYLSRDPLILKGALPGLSEGSHNLQIKVESVSYYYPPERASLGYGWWLMPPEEYKFDTLSEKVDFAIDTTPPEISVLSPENVKYNSSEVELTYLVDDLNAAMQYSLDGEENKTVSENVTFKGLLAGEHNVTFYARDEAGNVGVSETVLFSVAEPEYFPDFSATWAAPAVGLTVTLGAVLAFSYAARAKRKKQAHT